MLDEEGLIIFTTYRISDGELLQAMQASRIHLVDAQAGDDVDWVFGHHDPAINHVVDGEVVAKMPS